jgi:hypothetical protein
MWRQAAVLALLTLLAGAAAAQGGSVPAPSPSLESRADASFDELLGKIVAVKTSGGGNFRGTLFSAMGDRIELASPEGVLTAISRRTILSIEVVDSTRDQAQYFQDSAANRLIVMPTGFGMEKGELHVAAQEIVVITASYGISAHFSTWAGVSIPGAVLNLRWSTELGEPAALSLGSLAGFTWFESAGIVLPYALASFGHENRNFTIGAGVPAAWSPGGGFRPAGLVGTLAGKIIISPTTSIVTENWIVAYCDGWAWSQTVGYIFPAAVFRIAGDRFSWDIGAIVPLAVAQRGGPFLQGMMGGTVIPIPILSVTYRIN